MIASGYGSLNLSTLLGEKHANILALQKPYDMTMLEKTLTEAAARMPAA